MLNARHELVKDHVVSLFHVGKSNEPLKPLKGRRINCRVLCAASGPSVQILELYPQNRGLYLIEPRVKAHEFVIIPRLAAVHPKHARGIGYGLGVCGYHSAVAKTAEVL